MKTPAGEILKAAQDRKTKATLRQELEEARRELLNRENRNARMIAQTKEQIEWLQAYINKLIIARSRMQGALVAVSNARGLPTHIYHIVDDAQAAVSPQVDGKAS